MQRRLFLCSMPLLGGGLGACVQAPPVARASANSAIADFDLTLAEANRSAAFDSARGLRELDFRDNDLTESQTSMRGRRSERRIHPRAIDLIVSAEITSRARYERAFRRPIWPGGRSGVTIGLGYDLGFVSPRAFEDHWQDLLTPSQIADLRPACRLQGATAQAQLASFKDVVVDWAPAEKQFQRFLPYVIAETENTFPNCADLSEMSLGALVSLVYNRGSNTNKLIPRRVHMYQCKVAMQERKFHLIPGYLREMKVLWANEKDARGLLVRRDLEARLFEAGLS